MPPAVVRELFDDFQLGDEWIFPATREDQTSPVLTLRESATALVCCASNEAGCCSPRPDGDCRTTREACSTTSVIVSPSVAANPARTPACSPLLYAAAGEDFYDNRDAAAEAMASLGWASSGSLELAVWHESEPTGPSSNTWRDATRVLPMAPESRAHCWPADPGWRLGHSPEPPDPKALEAAASLVRALIQPTAASTVLTVGTPAGPAGRRTTTIATPSVLAASSFGRV